MPNNASSLLISGPPIPGESFLGYMLRLTQWNNYNRISWILYRGLGVERVNFWGLEHVDLMPLARFIGTDIKDLALLMNWRPETGLKNTGLFFGNFLSQYRAKEMRPKVCSLCLVEKDYYRKIWDLAYVTCCPMHKCLLIDHCPNCGKRISWNRSHVSICGCDYDWRNAIPVLTAEEDLKLTRLVFKLCSVSTNDSGLEADESNPLYSLGLEELLSAVTFMSAQYEMLGDTTGKHSLGFRNNEELNKFFSKGFAVFEQWPLRYYEFLTQRRAIREEAIVPSSVISVFNSFARILRRSFSSDDLKFMSIAFEHYLKEHWDSGVLHRRVLRFTGYDSNSRKYLPRHEAIKYLRRTADWIDKFVEEGRLNTIPIVGLERKLTLFRRSELDELKEYLKQLLTLSDVVKYLGVCREKVLALAEQGCLASVYRPGVNGWRWLFSRNDVVDLLSLIESKITYPSDRTDSLLTLKQAVLRLDCKITFGNIVRAILDDKIAPSGKVKGVGLYQFLFSERALRAYLSSEQTSVEGPFTVHQVAKMFRVRAGNVHVCIQEGLLPAQTRRKNTTTFYRVTKDAIDHFESTYVFAAKLENFGTSPRAMVALLREQGIHPISGPGTKEDSAFIFKRAELQHLNLRELLRKKRAKVDPRGTRYKSISAEKVAERLGIEMAALRALVTAKKLTPICEIPSEGGGEPSYRFSQKDFRRYTLKLRQRLGLVSSSEAASIIGVSFSFFRWRWCEGETRLNATRLPYGREMDYFKLEDIQRAKNFYASTVLTREAAKMLGVRSEYVARKLSPVSGPRVDGFGLNLYLRSDVEKYIQNSVSKQLSLLP